jgi:hypothetical protein
MCMWLLGVTATWAIMSRPNMCFILVLVAIYVPMAAVGYYNLGHQVKTKYVFLSSSGGYILYVPTAHGCCGLLQLGLSCQDQTCVLICVLF